MGTKCFTLLFALQMLAPAALAKPRKFLHSTSKLTQSFTWFDGKKKHTVWVDPSYVVEYHQGKVKESEKGLGVKKFSAEATLQSEDGLTRVWKMGAGADGAKGVKSMRQAQPAGNFSPLLRHGASSNSRPHGFPGGAIVTFRPEWAEKQIVAWLAGRGLAIEKKLEIGPNVYLVKTEPGLASIETANSLRATGEVLRAVPNSTLDIALF